MCAFNLREAEIENLDARFGCEDVGGLKVAMRDRLFVRGFGGGGKLDGELQRLFERQRPLDFGTIDVFHDQIVGAYVVERADVGMVEGGDGSRFLCKAIAESGGGGLDCDNAIKPRVAGFPDLSHTAFADAGEDFVGTEFCAWFQLH